MVKKALVTGSAGFVGGYMADYLDNTGWNVDLCDIKYDDSDPYFRDANWVFQTTDTVYDLVVHAAYRVGGRAEIDGKPANLHLNAQLDANLFEWAVRTKQKRVVYYSSSAAYPTALQENIDGYRLHEIDVDFDYPSKPDGRYGAAKLFGEQLAQAAREAGIPVTVVRPFSGYGTDQDLTYPFPAFIQRAARREDPFIIWGAMNQRRDFIHINDVIRGTMAIVDSGTALPINLCTGDSTTMYDLARIITARVGYEPEITQDLTKPMGVLNRVGDPKKFMQFYIPKIDIYEGVARALGTWKG